MNIVSFPVLKIPIYSKIKKKFSVHEGLMLYDSCMLYERDTGCDPIFDIINHGCIEITYMVASKDL